MRLSYWLDDEAVSVDVADTTPFATGDTVCLAERYDDPPRHQEWYAKGYTILPCLAPDAFGVFREALTGLLRGIITDLYPHKPLEGFTLETYHQHVRDDSEHAAIISRTRRLYPDEIRFDLEPMIAKVERAVGIPLCDRNSINGNKQWLILRINRPGSRDFNPVHKDVYQAVDAFGQAPRMVNCWMPICGVTERSGLPLALGSHLLREDQIERTLAGAEVDGRVDSVNCIRSWAGDNRMRVMAPDPGQLLVFSSHLIHGLSFNRTDQTRMSFELRLYETIAE